MILENYINLESLSLIGCGLKSVTNFPVLLNLLRLDLCDNKIRGSLKPLSVLNSLTMLSLAGNQISTIEQLQEISCLHNLASLDLYGCPVTEINQYSIKVFELFKNLQALDGMDKNGEEVSVESEYDESEGDDEDDSNDNEDSLSDFIVKDEGEPTKKRKDSEESNDSEHKQMNIGI